jgi:hypothetical protein
VELVLVLVVVVVVVVVQIFRVKGLADKPGAKLNPILSIGFNLQFLIVTAGVCFASNFGTVTTIF